MSQFHNPYHFVPLPESAGGPGRHPLPDGDASLPDQASHDRFAAESHSGKIRCQIITITPLVIGASRNDSEPKKVFPYMVPGTGDAKDPEKGVPGIPGSALRGMISSVIEAATHSAFRVLEDRHFSYRRSMAEGRSALGMIVRIGTGLELYPMADPHLELTKNGSAHPQPKPSDFSLENTIPRDSGNYGIMFRDSLRKIYFGTRPDIRKKSFFESYQSNSDGNGGPYYALPIPADDDECRKIKSKPQGPKTVFFDLGDQTMEMPEPWDDTKHTENTHIRGVLRVLGVYPKPDRRDPNISPCSMDREEGMGTRKHEMFLPLSKKEEESLKNGSAVTFPILAEALERFNQLADERTAEADKKTRPEDLLPFTPHGQQRDWPEDPDKSRPRHAYHLKPGDIVFFRPTEDGKSVAEVSLSSIWRGRVEKGREGSKTAATLSDFIASLDPDLLPIGDPRKKNLTPAELLFGYVEQKGKRALAGRLRFSDAKPSQDSQGPLLHSNWIDLQVLNSPKPPSPDFYFRKRSGKGHIAKSDLSLENHQIQGRKHYLHARNASSATKPDDPRWTMHRENVESGKFDRMRVRVKPILAGKSFDFEIQFDNLTDFELGALLHALRPAGDFRHKLGMGKPLGLGSINLEPLHIELVNRRKRYAEDPLTADRSTRYELADRDSHEDPKHPAELCKRFAATMDVATRTTIETLGDPGKVTKPVHYPQIEGPGSNNPAFETDRYEWFVSNDHKSNAKPQHVGQVTGEIPTLERLPKVERGRGGAGGGVARGPGPQHRTHDAP